MSEALSTPGGLPRCRPATPDDIPAIRRIAVAAWRAPCPWMPAGEREQYLEVACSRHRLRADLADPTVRAWISVDRDGVPSGAAFLLLDPDRDDCELCRLEVRPDRWGRGHGRALFTAAIAEARAAGRRVLWYSVFAHDRAAIAWCEHRGGRLSHGSERLFGAARIPEAVFRFELS